MPMPVLETIVSSYAAVGIAPHQLVALLPWFSCDFACTDESCAHTMNGAPLPEPIGGVACGFSYGVFRPMPTLSICPAHSR